MTRFLLLLTPLILTSCALLKVQDCHTANWDDVGYGKGRQGFDAEYIDRLEKACTQSPPAGSREKYQAGYSRGLKEYCTPEQFYASGTRNDWGFYERCPVEMRENLKAKNDLGREVYKLKYKANLMKDGIKLSELEAEIEEKEEEAAR